MRIRRIRGKSFDDALRRAQRMLGGDALVLSTEREDDGGVTLAVSTEGASALERLGHFGFGPAEPERRGVVPETGREADSSPAVRDVRRRLREHGCSPEWTLGITRTIEHAASSGLHAIDLAAKKIGQEFRIAPGPRPTGRVRAIAVVGPTGVGKTTTIAKLADRMVRSGRRVALATLDDFRVAAHDQLRIFAERLEVPFLALRAQRPIGALLDGIGRPGLSGPEIVLVDTSGRSQNDVRELVRTRLALSGLREDVDLSTYLVQSATTGTRVLTEVARAYSSFEPDGWVLTKLDETREPGVALEVVRAARAPLAFLCDGQEVVRHLHRATRDGVADLILRGRLA